MRNSAGKLGPGLDIRGDGGYIVVAPSVHPNGHAYEWEASSLPGRIALAPMPEWLLALVCEPQAKRMNGANGGIAPGARNERLASLAGTMRRRGVSAEDIATALLAQNTAHCRPPLAEDEVGQIAESIARYEPEDIADTDMANAARMAASYGRDLRYTPERGWLVWDGQRWSVDEAGAVVAKAKATVRQIYAELAGLGEREQKAMFNWVRRSQSAERLKAMVFLAQSEPGIPARLEDFDADPLVLNCANGTVCLVSGNLHPHARGDRISRVVDIDYTPGAPCPTWLGFLYQVMGGDAEMISFLQRAVGYTLTGNTGEQCLFFLYGTGSNGKSVFLETIKQIAGDYGLAASTQTLMASQQQGIPNDIARLAGRRFVAVGETEDGSRMRESLIKDLTGGDTITARYLRREYFDFRPHFKLWIRGNHKPQIRGTDEGIWRRIHLIPFAVQIRKEQRDPGLLGKLSNELRGILAWAVRGCLEYRQRGLASPELVRRATRDYREEMDVIGEFVADRCESTGQATAKELYQAYRSWCDDNGNLPLSQKRFGSSLSERGYAKERQRRGTSYRGIRLAV